MLNEQQIQDNWKRFREIVNTEFSGERKDKLNEMYDQFEERIVLAPASGKEHFHNAFPGGYIDHVLRVIDYSLENLEQWERRGATIDFTREELVFSAMHHDLYKAGTLTQDHYVQNDSQWHREKQGLIYKFNENIINMPSWMRSYYTLQSFGITMTEYEMISIQCADGMYSPDTETILKQHELAKALKTNLPHILHHADMCASRVEFDKWFKNKSLTNPLGITKRDDENPIMLGKKNIGRISTIVEKNNKIADKQKQIFDDLFK